MAASSLLASRVWGWAVPKGHPDVVQFLHRLVAQIQAEGRGNVNAARWLNGYDDNFYPRKCVDLADFASTRQLRDAQHTGSESAFRECCFAHSPAIVLADVERVTPWCNRYRLAYLAK